MSFLTDYGLFVAKMVSLIIGLLALAGGLAAILSRAKEKSGETLEIKKINDKYEEMADALNSEILSKHELKQFHKEEKKRKKEAEKASRKRIFVLNFIGDVKASGAHSLKEEVTALLTVANKKDEIVVCVESSGGLVSGYGYAASQLQRIRNQNIPLTIAVDEVAASGGYMMACVANKILAAPFSIIGSIGVIAQIPNFHRLLKKHDIDFEQITAGEYKRTLTVFGENTHKGREKLQEEIEEMHDLFKEFIVKHRPTIDIGKVATGEYWMGQQALELGLVDQVMTSDDYLFQESKNADIYSLEYIYKESLKDKLSSFLQSAQQKVSMLWRRW